MFFYLATKLQNNGDSTIPNNGDFYFVKIIFVRL